MPAYAGHQITLPLRARLLKPVSHAWNTSFDGQELELSWQWGTRRPWLSWVLVESRNYELVQDGRRRRWRMYESSLQFTRRRVYDNLTCFRPSSRTSGR